MRIGSKENDLDRAQFLCRARFRVLRRLGSNDSCGTNNSRIVLGIRCNAKVFFRFTETLHFAAAQAVSPSLRRSRGVCVHKIEPPSEKNPARRSSARRSAALVFTIPSDATRYIVNPAFWPAFGIAA
jgi:hypothetical protein